MKRKTAGKREERAKWERKPAQEGKNMKVKKCN